MLKIRLSRVGKSHSPIYRLVVAEKSRAVKRENIEILGLYNPTNKDEKFQVKKDRVLFWISQGAQPSDTARNLLCDFDVLPKSDKIKIVHGKAKKKNPDKFGETSAQPSVDTAEEPAEESEKTEESEAEVEEVAAEPEVAEEVKEDAVEATEEKAE